MNNIKDAFSIKDLENLSGIKAHTIRIWEKRYAVLAPSRTDGNIRTYSTSDLQKLLNMTLLHNYGYKISKVSKLTDAELVSKIREITSTKIVQNSAINSFKIAMMHFSRQLFEQTYELLLSHKPFDVIFHEVFIPLLDEIGLLWQTNTITPAHEHFISHQIRMRLLINTIQIQDAIAEASEPVYVLFLPLNEIHELGLLYLNYILNSNKCHTIYLGESIPKENLSDLTRRFEKVTFISYATVTQETDELTAYFEYIDEQILNRYDARMLLFGRGASNIDQLRLSDRITFADDIKNLKSYL